EVRDLLGRTSRSALRQAQEQPTLSQRVPGSSPGAPTKLFRHLATSAVQGTGLVLQFWSRFGLQYGSLGELDVATEMNARGRLDILQRVAVTAAICGTPSFDSPAKCIADFRPPRSTGTVASHQQSAVGAV